jgi:hypothetical protein
MRKLKGSDLEVELVKKNFIFDEFYLSWERIKEAQIMIELEVVKKDSKHQLLFLLKYVCL